MYYVPIEIQNSKPSLTMVLTVYIGISVGENFSNTHHTTVLKHTTNFFGGLFIFYSVGSR